MMFRSLFLPTSLLFLSLVTASPAFSETKVITAEATYIMGDGETPTFAEAMALQKAKQIALEQAGTYLESYTKIQNYKLSMEEIQTIAGGVLQVEIQEKSRTLVGEGLRLFLKIKATVTTDKVTELAKRVKAKNVQDEYKKLQADYARLEKEIETWKQFMAKTPPGPERDRAASQLRDRVRDFEMTQKHETTFFRRLIAGEALVEKALDVQKKLDKLFETVVLHGNSILIGEPRASLVQNSNLKIVVPVTLKASDEVPIALRRAKDKLGVRTWKAIYDDNVIFASLSDERTVQDNFLNRIRKLVLALEFHFSDGTIRNCSISGVSQIYPVRDRPPINASDNFKWAVNNNLMVIDGTPVTVSVMLSLPQRQARSLENVSSRFFSPTKDDRDVMKNPCTIEAR